MRSRTLSGSGSRIEAGSSKRKRDHETHLCLTVSASCGRGNSCPVAEWGMVPGEGLACARRRGSVINKQRNVWNPRPLT
jgi:hypothetical protein